MIPFFYGFRNGSWSEAGCHVNSTNISYTVCHCYHLTSFAVLMSVKEDISQISVSNFQYLGQPACHKFKPLFHFINKIQNFFSCGTPYSSSTKSVTDLWLRERHRTLDLKVGFKNCYPTRIFSLSCEWCWCKLRSASFFTSLFFILEEHPCMMAKWHFPVIYNYLMSSLFR